MGCLTGRIHEHAGMPKEPQQENSKPDAGPPIFPSMIEGIQHSTNDDGNTPAENFAAHLNSQPCDTATDGASTQQEEPDVN
jgi:hypothetical protein